MFKRSTGAVGAILTVTWRGVAAIVLIASVLLYLPSRAYAFPAKPATSPSYYIDVANNSTALSNGCNQAGIERSAGTPSEVILDFGGMAGPNGEQELFNGTIVPWNTVASYTEYYITGYEDCSPTQVLILDLGTNTCLNGNSTVWSGFAQTINNVVAWIVGAQITNVDLIGANDIETWQNVNECSNPMTASEDLAWYSTWSATTSDIYADYGSADGCPLNLSGTCSDNFYQGTYYNLSWGYPQAIPAPEIYYNVNAEEWYYISVYGQANNGPLYPEGPLDEYPLNTTTNTSSQAWSDLTNYLASKYSMELTAYAQ